MVEPGEEEILLFVNIFWFLHCMANYNTKVRPPIITAQ